MSKRHKNNPNAVLLVYLLVSLSIVVLLVRYRLCPHARSAVICSLSKNSSVAYL